MIHRQSSRTDDSVEPLISVDSSYSSGSDQVSQPRSFEAQDFNAFAFGFAPATMPKVSATPIRDANKQSSSNATSKSAAGSSPPSSSIGNKSDVEALFASFYPNGVNGTLVATQNNDNNQPSFSTPSPFNTFNAQPSIPSFAQDNGDAGAGVLNSMAYRDTTPALDMTSSAPNHSTQDLWADFTDNGVNDFLASLTGEKNDIAEVGGAEDDFQAQLQQILGQKGYSNSPSPVFAFPPNGPAFSPSNYLNVSPSPMDPVSDSQSPSSQKTTNSQSPFSQPNTSNSGSPAHTYPSATSLGSGVDTFGPPKKPGEHVHVVDENGQIIKPSDLWVKMGLQHTVGPDLVIHIIKT